MNKHSYNIDMEISNINLLKKIEKFLKVSGDITRLKILFCLIDEKKCNCNSASCNCSKCQKHGCMIEKCVSDIVSETKCEQSLISHQLKVLKNEGFVKTRKEGLRVFYSLKDGHVKEMLKVVIEHAEE